jgi:hypothetical protein
MRKLEDVTIQFVSIVTKGANKRKFFLTKEDKQNDSNVTFSVKTIFDKEDPLKLVYGVVYEPDIEDAHGDIMDAVEIEKMAHNFLVNYRLVDKNHNKLPGAGDVAESYIAPVDFQIGKEIITKGSWVLVTKADDEVWEQIQKGEFTGYSMSGWANKVKEIEKESSQDLFIRIAKHFNIDMKTPIFKDFAQEVQNMENNDIYTYLRLLTIAIDDIKWTSNDKAKMKEDILSCIKQFETKIKSMTFEVLKSDNGDDDDKPKLEKTKGEKMKDEALKTEQPDVVKPIVEPVTKENGSEQSLEDNSKNLNELKKEMAELKKSLEEISNVLLANQSKVGLEKTADSKKPIIGFFAKTV